MVLVDTSVWIDHFNRSDLKLEYLLNDYEAAIHPYILGELACGNFKNRKLIVSLLNALPVVPEISKEEYFPFVERHKLYGRGLGFIDIHILASALLAHSLLYTRDKQLFLAADALGISYK